MPIGTHVRFDDDNKMKNKYSHIHKKSYIAWKVNARTDTYSTEFFRPAFGMFNAFN